MEIQTATVKPQQLIVFAGLPGSGKSTLAEGLSRVLSIPVFSVDPIEAAMWRGGLAKDKTGIAAYDVAITLADEQLRLGHSVIADAVNRRETSGRSEDNRMLMRQRERSPPAHRSARSQYRRHA
jgi:predicted kinase